MWKIDIQHALLTLIQAWSCSDSHVLAHAYLLQIDHQTCLQVINSDGTSMGPVKRGCPALVPGRPFRVLAGVLNHALHRIHVDFQICGLQ